MKDPFFFAEELNDTITKIFLDEKASKHAIQVLRMKEGSSLNLANGKGILASAKIVKANSKKSEVVIDSIQYLSPPIKRTAIGISLVKNTARFEWFVEKATELGITEIIPLLCYRTERQLFKRERLMQIMINAMLQSRQSWMPILHIPLSIGQVIQSTTLDNKFIAHCEKEQKKELSHCLVNEISDTIILIGPEGDFTKEEIDLALMNKFVPVSLGETRLRTETAGIAAATLIKLV